MSNTKEPNAKAAPTKEQKVRYAMPAPPTKPPATDMDLPEGMRPATDMDLPEGMRRILERAFEADPVATFRDLEAAGRWELARDLKLAHEIRKKRAMDAAAA